MRKISVKILAYLMGYKLVDLLFLMRMQSIETHMRMAVREYSFVLLDSAHNRLLWESHFKHSKIEHDMIFELLNIHDECREVIKQNLAAECGVKY